jgi:hypothetical protein
MGDDNGWRAELTAGDVDDRIACARLLRVAAGVSAADWVFSSLCEREKIHLSGLVKLVQAAGARLFGYVDLPRCSKARSDVLLKGAAALGIETDWGGWA